MEWVNTFIPEAEIVLTTVHGLVTIEDVKRIAFSRLDLAKQHGTHKFITDYRAASQIISILEIHTLPQTLLDLGITAADKVALVYTADATATSNFSFFNTRCFNSSLNIRAFTDYDEAYGWLIAL